MNKEFQTIIIGCGPAGLQTSLYLGRAKISTLIIGSIHGSDLARGEAIGNYFGLKGEPTGLSLLEHSVKQAKKYDVEFVEEEVVDLQQTETGFKVMTEQGQEFAAQTVVIATGIAHTKAGIQREEDFFGKGIHTCVACDGVFFKGKTVGVVGYGSHAAQEAIELTTFTDKVTIYTQGREPEWTKQLDALVKSHNIGVESKTIKAVTGETMIDGAQFRDGSTTPLNGIFVALGTASSVTFANKLGLLQEGSHLKVDLDGKTNVEGVWAAGSAIGGNPQIAVSAGSGVNAGISIIKKMKGLEDYTDQT